MQARKYNKILIIDDSELDNYINKILLEKLAIAEEVETISNPREALEILQKMPSEKFPEVLLIDINMPEMTGFELIEILEREIPDKFSKSISVILSSSDDNYDMQKAAEFKSIKGYFIKPLETKKISEIL